MTNPSAEELGAEHERALTHALYITGNSVSAANQYERDEEVQNLAYAYRELAASLRAQEGWVLVPREPTEEQWDSVCDKVLEETGGMWPGISIAQHIWRAMLSALPAAPGGKNG